MPRSVRLTLIVVLAVVLGVLVALMVTDDDDSSGEPDWATCRTEAVGAEAAATFDEPLPAVTATLVADVALPTDLAIRPDDEHLYVAAREGQVLRIDDDGDASVITEVDVVLDKEQGLLSLDFDPTGEHLYLTHTDLEGTSLVLAYPIDDQAGLGDPVTILELEQLGGNHNIGQVRFGPDGYLWISSGDGGSVEREGDVDRLAQDPANWYGTILRIDPDPVAGGYEVPADNPFADDPDAAPEVWSYGFRNPWRFSFDPATDDVWITDVGQFCWEEVNVLSVDESRGANFGWSAYEGFHRHHEDQDPDTHVLPVHAYQRLEGTDTSPPQCAIIGGHVVRGEALGELDGTYLYGDFCSREVRALRHDDAGGVEMQVLVDGFSGIQSLAQPADGHTYVLDANGVHRLEPADGP